VPPKSDIRELLYDVSVPDIGVSLCHPESNDIQEKESASEYGPYGSHYEKITEEHLKQIALELGLIKLYWPKQLTPDVDQYVCNYISLPYFLQGPICTFSRCR
jgi:hypothetical protein